MDLWIYGQTLVEASELMASYWDAVGVKTKLNVMETAVWNSFIFARKWEGAAVYFGGNAMPWSGIGNRLTGAYWNYGSWSDLEYDKKLADMYAEPDATKRYQMIKELNLDCVSGWTTVVFPTPYITIFWQPWVKGYHGEATLQSLSHGSVIARVWLDQAMKKSLGK
jgi:ABC-type transport system substrate-binding protein